LLNIIILYTICSWERQDNICTTKKNTWWSFVMLFYSW